MMTLTTGSTDPAIALLIEVASIPAGARTLILNGEDPALAIAAARTAAHVAVYADSAGALARVQSPLQARQLANVTLSDVVFPDETSIGAFDVTLLPLPKGREYARGLLWAARWMLVPGGKLYMAGANESGIKTLFADAAVLFGSSATLIIRHRCRVGVSIQPHTSAPPIYPAAWGADPLQPQTLDLGALKLTTMPGVFSWQALDDGTAFLLEQLTINAGEHVLDVGCGYGVLGLIAAMRGAAQVTMTDDSLLAVYCARASVKRYRNAAVPIEVVAGDLFAGVSHHTYDLIVSNPPFHRQFETDSSVARRLIRDAGTHLKPGGRLLLVGNAFLRYDKLMRDSFGMVRTVAENSRYAVWEAKK